MDADVPNGFDERVQKRAASQLEGTLETTPATQGHRGYIPNTPLAASTISFVLGTLFCLGMLTFLGKLHLNWWSTNALGFYVAAWSAFHWGEFAVTAGWNREKCSVDSFLLENGRLYHITHCVALVEYLLTLHLKPSFKSYANVYLAGIPIVLIGQLIRSLAMIQASTNFSHTIAFQKRQSHTLVTDGIYAWFRHPSYAGFFYWALGTQIVLQNPFSFILFTVLLWKFFNNRIKVEERLLIKFFGADYEKYRQRVGSKIPFIA